MFTGLIREIGSLQAVQPARGAVRLDIRAPVTAGRVAAGDSVAVDGICLTVTRARGRVFSVSAVGETRRLTTMNRWRSGRRLHLEPALRVGDALDGHLMQGHVDGVGRVARVRKQGGSLAVTIAADAPHIALLTAKGSVAVDGVSLTVDEGPFDGQFTVFLIPHTLTETHFGGLRAGDVVNLEMDILVKAARGGNEAERPAPTGRTMAQLLAKGFARQRARK